MHKDRYNGECTKVDLYKGKYNSSLENCEKKLQIGSYKGGNVLKTINKRRSNIG